MKKLFMETTNISALQTVSQIQTMLGESGAHAVMTEYAVGQVSALSFQLEINGKKVPFRLPCRHEAIFHIMIGRKKRGTHNDRIMDNMKDQAKRVAWRQVLRWVEAQLALVKTEMVSMQEVFMPYVQIGKDQTLFQVLNEKGFALKQLEHIAQ